MTDNLFHYISPWLYPVMPEASGVTVVSLDFHSLLYDASPNLVDNDNLKVRFELWYEGALQSKEEIAMTVKDGVVTPQLINREYSLPGFGFVQMTIDSGMPYFRKIEIEKGYGLLMRPEGGSTTVLPQSKYADGVIIQNIRGTGTFCLVHPAHYMDKSKGVGNSALLLNPYDGPLVATIMNEDGKKLKKKILSGCASLVSLEPLLQDREQSCIMYTGTNRFPGWDVRHSIDNPNDINHMDHLEYYRPIRTYNHMNLLNRLRAATKRFLYDVGYIC